MFLSTWVVISLLVGVTYLLKFLGEGQGMALRIGSSDVMPLLTKGLAVISALALIVSAFYFLVESLRHPQVPWLIAYPAALLYLGVCVGLALVMGITVGIIHGEVRIDWTGQRKD